MPTIEVRPILPFEIKSEYANIFDRRDCAALLACYRGPPVHKAKTDFQVQRSFFQSDRTTQPNPNGFCINNEESITAHAISPPFLSSSSHRRSSTRISHRDINHARILRHNRNTRNSSGIRRRSCHALLRLCFGRSTLGNHDG